MAETSATFELAFHHPAPSAPVEPVEIQPTGRAPTPLSLSAAYTFGGFIVSAGLHGALLVVFACWILPALKIGSGRALLQVDVASSDALDEDAFSRAVSLDAGLEGADRALASFVVPPESTFPTFSISLAQGIGEKTGSASGSLYDNVGDLTGKQVGPAVRFFGSEAYGRRFVFILDASGSMNQGARFKRAAEELLDTLDGLSEEQEFFVVLFQGQAFPMLRQSPETARMLPATEENKQQLEYWLAGVHPISWSDPREAIRLALKLKPSAIFLLSDGEFKSGPRTKRLGGATLRLTGHLNESRVPIHTIAYEDAVNRRVLRAMARTSGGSYQYVPPADAKRLR